jgi:hypothetical protein
LVNSENKTLKKIFLKNIKKGKKNAEFCADFKSGEKIFTQQIYDTTNFMVMSKIEKKQNSATFKLRTFFL